MAYSLGDPYRSLRLLLRVNGVLIGLLLGLFFLLMPARSLATMGLATTGLAQPEGGFALRVAGAALVACGLFLILGSQPRDIDLPVIVPAMVLHALLALVILFAYLGGQLDGLTVVGQIGLLVVFLLCLIGALAPVRYFRAEFRT